jgi:putative transposase
MYDYRSMSPLEREAIVAWRRARGFPLHKPPHLVQGEGWYFVSATTYEHRRYFSRPAELTALERRLLEALKDADIPCAGWVVLPNHYHIMVAAAKVTDVGNAIGPVHGRSAHYANQRDNAPGRKVWFKYNDRKMRSDRHFWACLHYAICNPVKHGYVRAPEDWPWSCYREWIDAKGTAWFDELMREYPLGEFGAGWDP